MWYVHLGYHSGTSNLYFAVKFLACFVGHPLDSAFWELDRKIDQAGQLIHLCLILPTSDMFVSGMGILSYQGWRVVSLKVPVWGVKLFFTSRGNVRRMQSRLNHFGFALSLLGHDSSILSF